MSNSYAKIDAVMKTFEILRFLSEQRAPVSAAEIVKGTGMTKGTVMCHLATLEHERIIRQVGGHYELGSELALFHARYKAMLQQKKSEINSMLAELGE